jgi:phage terminase large subunit-like protein
VRLALVHTRLSSRRSRTLTWPNGCRGFTYSSEVPDKLRGPQHHKFWGDELCKWKHAQDTWDNLQFGLRLGDNPQGVITTTPRPIATLKEILADPATVSHARQHVRQQAQPAEAVPRSAAAPLRRHAPRPPGAERGAAHRHAGRALDAEDHRSVPRAPGAGTLRVGVAIDPGASDPSRRRAEADGHAETGIVAGGVDDRRHPYVLRDAAASPHAGGMGQARGHALSGAEGRLHRRRGQQRRRDGAHVVQTAARDLRRSVNVRLVHASRGKQTRAEPVSALYEQKRARHVGAFPDLEDQMSTWVPGQKSPTGWTRSCG